MIESDFLKRSYRPYQQMDYQFRDKSFSCMIVAIYFDERLFKLQSFETSEIDAFEFWVRCEHCELPKQKLKIIK